MTQKPQPRLPQFLTHLSLNPPRDTNALKGSVSRLDAIESAALAFFNEVFTVGGFGGDELGDGGEEVVGIACFWTVRGETVSWCRCICKQDGMSERTDQCYRAREPLAFAPEKS